MISIVICTRDRAAKLARCLRHISDNFRDPALAWQLVIVDNASRDGTNEIIAEFSRRLPLMQAFEARPGLSHARNRGIAEATHAIIAFTDDDCLIDDGWARAIVTAFGHDRALAVLGGSVGLADPADYPVSLRTHADAQHVTSAQQILHLMSGCNMAFRREVFEQVGRFDPVFGKGRPIGSGEDLDFLYRALKSGCKIAYAPYVAVRHAHGRNTPEALKSVAREYGRGRGAFYCKFITDRQIAKMAYWEVWGLLGECLRLPPAPRSLDLLCSLATGALYRSMHGTLNGAARAMNRLTH